MSMFISNDTIRYNTNIIPYCIIKEFGDDMRLFIQGIIVGFVIVLPGMSGGTVFLVFGLYENMVKDIMHLKIKPYLSLAAGMILGIFISGYAFGLFFEHYRDATVALLLGCLLASTRSILKGFLEIRRGRVVMLALGIIVGWLMIVEPLGVAVETAEVSWWLLLTGGALSTAAMIIPGLPGSSVLILMGIYDTIMFSVKNLEFMNLVIFGIGSILGIFLLLNLLAKLYDKYKALLSYLFAGLIVGSTRGLIPSDLNIWTAALAVIGFAAVWILSGDRHPKGQQN
jgi:putative membrane protein